PTWGTTSRDRAALAACGNIALLEPAEDIREILRQTRVLLAPSLWPEARGRVIVEAMLCGVPVLASDIGGIREVTMGVPCLLPVRPIVRYERRVDELMIRVPEVPDQDVEPWRQALGRLTSDREHYATMSTLAKEGARAYTSHLDLDAFE